MGRNENEPHLMSPEMFRTGDKPSRCLIGEGRREEAGQQSEPSQRSGGVGVDGTSVSSVHVSWENCGGGCEAQPTSQAGSASEAGGAVGEVGVPHSSDEAPVTGVERRWDTCSEVRCDRWLMAPQGDRPPRGSSSSTLMEGARGNAQTRPELGEPNMGKPSVRFDEGREGVGHWPCASQPDLSCLLYQFSREKAQKEANKPRFGTRRTRPTVRRTRLPFDKMEVVDFPHFSQTFFVNAAAGLWHSRAPSKPKSF
jgi:hypothetical protein